MDVWTCIFLMLLPLATCQEEQPNENNSPPPMHRDRYPPPREYSVNFPQDFPPRGHFPRGPPNFPQDFPKPPGPYEHSVSRYNRIQVPNHGERGEYDNNDARADQSAEVNRETGENRDWRHCYVCSGMFPDRECELYPKYVTKGPGRINCTRDYCTVFVRYTPKKYLLTFDDDGKPSAVRSLGPNDYEVTSIARECEESSRGNRCVLDGDDMGLTCYDTCTTSLCNDVIRAPSEDDFVKFRKTREEEQSIPTDPEPPKPKDQEQPSLSPPKFKQMPPSRDPKPANHKPGLRKPDMTSPEKMDGPMREQEREDKMGGRKGGEREPKRAGKPSKKADILGSKGEAGFSKSSAGSRQCSVFSAVSFLGLYVCAWF